MGTNFYTKKDHLHIGKRSAAGTYCWDCGVTFCKDGEGGIHYSEKSGWFDSCPVCGAKKKEENLSSSSAGKELGFSSIKGKQTGVSSCCSFSWAVRPIDLPHEEVEDEYGNVFSWEEFKEELDYCPIQYFHSIGQDFS